MLISVQKYENFLSAKIWKLTKIITQINGEIQINTESKINTAVSTKTITQWEYLAGENFQF